MEAKTKSRDNNHLKAKGCDDEVVIVDSQRGKGNDDAKSCRANCTKNHVDEEIRLEVKRQESSGIRADAIESCMSDREKAGITGYEVKGDDENRIDRDKDKDVKEIIHQTAAFLTALPKKP